LSYTIVCQVFRYSENMFSVIPLLLNDLF